MRVAAENLRTPQQTADTRFALREMASSEFMTACQFLNDHMDNMDNPNNEMVCHRLRSRLYIIGSESCVPQHQRHNERLCFCQRKALIVLFQRWFSVAAEETSPAADLAVYLKEVGKATPTLLAFLVNLADDNGNTVLHYSVSHCNYSIVGLLLDTGDPQILAPGWWLMLMLHFDPFQVCVTLICKTMPATRPLC